MFSRIDQGEYNASANWKLLTKKHTAIRDFNSTAASTSTATELYEKCSLASYTSRVNPGSLGAAAKAVNRSAKAAGKEVPLLRYPH